MLPLRCNLNLGMMVRWMFLSICLGTALAPADSWGQTQQSQPSQKDAAPSANSAAPSVDKIIDHYVAAVGGRAAWQKLTSRVSMGTIEVPSANLSGTVVIHEKAPNKILAIIIVSGSAFRQGFDGTVGWAEDPQSGIREQSGAELAEARRQGDFYSPLNTARALFENNFSGFGEGERSRYLCARGVSAEGGQPDKLYFDAQSGLPVRLISQHHSPEGVSQFQEDFGDWRRVDGVTLPFSISQTGGDTGFVVKIERGAAQRRTGGWRIFKACCTIGYFHA